MFVGAVERLEAPGGGIPGNTDGKDVGIGGAGAFDGSEVKLNALDGILIVLDAPAGDGRKGSEGEEALGVFEIFVAAEKLIPFVAIFFGKDGASDDGTGNGFLGIFGNNVSGKEFLLAGFGEITEDEDGGFLAKKARSGGLHFAGYGGFGRLGFGGRLGSGLIAAGRKKQRKRERSQNQCSGKKRRKAAPRRTGRV